MGEIGSSPAPWQAETERGVVVSDAYTEESSERRTGPAEDADGDRLPRQRLVEHPLHARAAPVVQPALRERQRAVPAAELVARAVDRAEGERVGADLGRVEVVLRLDVGVGVVADGGRGADGGPDEVGAGEDEDEEGEEDPDAVGDAEAALAEARRLFQVGGHVGGEVLGGQRYVCLSSSGAPLHATGIGRACMLARNRQDRMNGSSQFHFPVL